jgi:cell division septation protein DedD
MSMQGEIGGEMHRDQAVAPPLAVARPGWRLWLPLGASIGAMAAFAGVLVQGYVEMSRRDDRAPPLVVGAAAAAIPAGASQSHPPRPREPAAAPPMHDFTLTDLPHGPAIPVATTPAPAAPSPQTTCPAESLAAVLPPPPPAPPPRSVTRRASKATPAPSRSTPTPRDASREIFRVQIAAVRSDDEVEPIWSVIRRTHPELLGGLTMSTSRIAVDDERAYIRIQAGPIRSRASAQAICRQMTQSGDECFVIGP